MVSETLRFMRRNDSQANCVFKRLRGCKRSTACTPRLLCFSTVNILTPNTFEKFANKNLGWRWMYLPFFLKKKAPAVCIDSGFTVELYEYSRWREIQSEVSSGFFFYSSSFGLKGFGLAERIDSVSLILMRASTISTLKWGHFFKFPGRHFFHQSSLS